MEPTESDAFEVPKPPETDGPEEVEEPEKKRHALPSWAVLPWLALLAGLLLVPLSIGAEVAAELRVETSGLVKAAGGGTAAAAGATTQSTLQELQTLPEADLRRIRDCSFVHHGTFHRLRVASLVRTRTDVTIVAPDRATLQIGAQRVIFSRPFAGSQEVEPDPSNDGPPSGCTFTGRTDVSQAKPGSR
mmetsp:Transcript_133634/g.188857  ORF Transcript_133634/g.188857 Transcript_133634/m.188857 type:complete len:189 (+) Transcript_133634:32-598(+)